MAETTLDDDLSIPNTDRLFRRVPPHQLITCEDGKSPSVLKRFQERRDVGQY